MTQADTEAHLSSINRGFQPLAAYCTLLSQSLLEPQRSGRTLLLRQSLQTNGDETPPGVSMMPVIRQTLDMAA